VCDSTSHNTPDKHELACPDGVAAVCLTPEQIEAFEERAAVLEFDMGLPREVAEARAAAELGLEIK